MGCGMNHNIAVSLNDDFQEHVDDDVCNGNGQDGRRIRDHIARTYFLLSKQLLKKCLPIHLYKKKTINN